MNYFNYFTEIEDHFVRRRGKHLLLSPMDWGLIASWRDAGVPLQVALRGIDIAMDGFLKRRRRGSSKVNSLCYCHDSVMAEFAAYLESHVGEPSAGAQNPPSGPETGPEEKDEPGKEQVLAFLSERIREIKELCEKQFSGSGISEGVGRALARLEAMMRDVETGSRIDAESLERDLAMIEEILTAELRAAVSGEEMTEWEKEAKKELKVYRKRLPKDTYDRIHRNFLRGKIRRKFQIGEFSLFHL
jgi:hypothetical protein